MLSLRTKRYIADIWLGGFTIDEFWARVQEMEIPTSTKYEAKMFWHKMEMSFLRAAPKEKK